MTKKEKKLITIFLALLAVGVVFKGIPYALEVYQEGVEDVQFIKKQRRALKELSTQNETWQQEFNNHKKHEQALMKKVFQGASRDVIAAKLQGQLRDLARKNQVEVNSMDLPAFISNEDWLLIVQVMSFKATEQNMVNMLASINHHQPTLKVLDLSLRSYRNKLNGSIKVVGFNRLEHDSEANE